MGKPVKPTEHTEQVRFVHWFRRTYPDVRIIAVPNGGWRNKLTAMRLRAEGVMPGVPDLFIPEWSTWIEMKRTDGGITSVSQKDWMMYLKSIGHRVQVCYGCDEAMAFIDGVVRDELS